MLREAQEAFFCPRFVINHKDFVYLLPCSHSALRAPCSLTRARLALPLAVSYTHDVGKMNRSRGMILTLLCLLALPLYVVFSGEAPLGRDFRTADRSSAGLAPPADSTPEAVVQVYAARALNWRGIFGVHTWIATKPENATGYMVHQVIGWRIYRNLPAVSSAPGIPDGRWFGNEPYLIAELRGAAAARAIPIIMKAVEDYPYANEYQLWPGPNSNTFTAYIGRQVPELRMDLPPNAIGKDYPINGSLIDKVPSGTGYQFSMFGLFGLMMAKEEGLELNLLGLSFGVDFLKPALKLPIIGRLGASSH